MPSGRACEEPEHPRDRETGHADHYRGAAGEEPEGDARVLDVPDGEGAEDVDAPADVEGSRDDLLRQLIREDCSCCNRYQGEPLRRACRERALGCEDRPDRVRRGSEAYVRRRSGRLVACGLDHWPLPGQ